MPSTDAEREADGDFTPAPEGTKQQQSGDVGARDQDEDNRHSEEPDRDARFRYRAEVLSQATGDRPQERAGSTIRFGVHRPTP